MKLWNYIFIFTGLALLLEFGGIHSSGIASLVRLIGITTNSTGITNFKITSSLWNAILGSSGILISLVFGVSVGYLTKSSPENYIILPLITGTLYFWGSVIVGIVIYGINYSPWIATGGVLILAPFAVGFFLALVEFFRGTD